MLQRVPIATLVSFLEAIGTHPHADLTVIGAFAGGLSATTARRALVALESSGLTRQEADHRYVCVIQGVRRGIPDEDARAIVRKALQSTRAFEAVCEGLAIGENEHTAVRRAAIMLGKHDVKDMSVLVGWGEELGILKRSNGEFRLAPEIIPTPTNQFGVITAQDVESEARARLYNATRVGRDANNFLDETDRALLAEATLKYASEPHLSVEKSGQALEDYLRELCNKSGFGAEAKTCNGAGQLGSLLVNKSLIHSHHNQFIQAVATARNTTAHRKDKKTLKPWDITPHGAFWALTGALAIIRSVHEFIYGGRQTL